MLLCMKCGERLTDEELARIKDLGAQMPPCCSDPDMREMTAEQVGQQEREDLELILMRGVF